MISKCLLMASFAANLLTAETKPPPWQKAPLLAGRDLFRENCAVCHDVEKDQRHTRKLGPSFYHLFQNQSMPLSHMKPNRQYVTVRIKFGGVIMPAFAKTLNDSQIKILIDFIASQ